MEQIATNAAIANLVTSMFHVVIIGGEMILGYIALRYRNENKRQQDQIDECRRTLATIDDKLARLEKKLDANPNA